MNMENSPLSEAVLHANISGITHMKHQNYSRSIAMFRRGLKAIQGATRQAMTSATEMKNDKSDSSLDDSVDVLEASLGFQDDKFGASQHYVRPIQSTSILDENTTSEYDSSFLLFDRALIISAEFVNLIEHSAIVQDLASAVLVYNMGLAYHLEGLRTGMSLKLLQANRFYKISYCLLYEEYDSIAALAKMALVNNTGHIHAYFCGYYEASVCSQDLLAYYHDPNNDSCLHTFLSDEESAIFSKNCTCFLDWQNVAAPAA